MKKLASIFLALTLLAGLLAVPAAADETNLLENGSFEKYEEGRFTGWTVQTTTDSGNTSYQSHEAVRDAHTNWGYCLSLSKNKDFAYYYIENVQGGKTYELSFDYQSLTDGRLEIMLSSRPTGGEAADYSYIFLPATGGEWERYAFKYVVPEESNRVQVSFRVGSAAGEDGEAVKVDEVKFCAADSDENFGFENDLDGWMVSDGAEVSEDANTGAKSLKLSAGETASKIVLTDGNSVDICGYVKATAGATASVKATPIRRADDYTSAEEISVSDTEWKKAEFKTLLTGDEPSATLKVFFPVLLELSVTGEGEAYFDSFAIDAYTNLVTDPSFEKASTNTYWRNRTSGGALAATFRAADATAPNGDYVLSVPAETVKPGFKNLIEIPLEAGKFYEFSFWMSGTSGHTQAYVYLYEEGAEFGANLEPQTIRINFGQVARTHTASGTPVWRKQSVIFYAPKAGETAYNDVSKTEVTFTNDTAACWVQVGKTASDAANPVSYDMFCLREVEEYAGFYDDSSMQYINDRKVDSEAVDTQYDYTALGAPITTLSAGTYEFKFGNAALSADTDTAMGIVALYERKGDGSEMLKKVLAISNSKYADIDRPINASSTGADKGYQVSFTLSESDMDDENTEYYVKGFGWTSATGMAPLATAAVLEK